MALKQETIIFNRKDESGNTVMQFPITCVENVEGAASQDYVDEQVGSSKVGQMTGATASSAGTSGLVPAPAAGVNDRALCGDGTFKTLPIAGGGTGVTTIEELRELIGGMSVGFEYFQMNPNIPVGSLPLFGGEYSREAYADLWEWIQTQGTYFRSEAEWQETFVANEGNVPFYSDGDGSTTFRVPSLACHVQGASGVEKVGSYLQAGLPNITGAGTQFRAINGYAHSYTGAFYAAGKTSGKADTANTDATTYDTSIGFDASRSNPIYGNSDTVQPKSIVGMWLVKAFGTVSNVGNQDVADISAGLTRVETTLNSSISKLSISGKTITYTKNDGSTGTITTQDTTYSAATTSAAGLMSASDKTKLNNLSSSEGGVITATCSTGATTASKVVTVTSGTFTLKGGVMIAVTFSNAIGLSSNSSSQKTKITLNVNSTGAKNILCDTRDFNTSAYFMTLNSYLPKGSYMFYYDGTQWVIMGQIKVQDNYYDPNGGGT